MISSCVAPLWQRCSATAHPTRTRAADSRTPLIRCQARRYQQQQQQQQQQPQQQHPLPKQQKGEEHHTPIIPTDVWIARVGLTLAHGGACTPAVVVLMAVLALSAWPVGPAVAADGVQHHEVQSMLDLAEGEEFWGNVAKYGRYFVTVMLGTGYVMVQPLLAAFKRPATAVTALILIGGGFILLKFTLAAMLGMQEPFVYNSGSVVPYS